MRIEITNTGGLNQFLGDEAYHETWAQIGVPMRYIAPLLQRWNVDLVVEAIPPTAFRRQWWYEMHWFVEADLGTFIEWAMREYDSELVVSTNAKTVEVEIYDDYRE